MNTIFKLCELAAYFFEALICYFFIQLFFPEKAKGKIRFFLLSGVLLVTVFIADSLHVFPFLVTLWFVFYICMTTVLIFHVDVFYAVSLVSFYILCVYIIDFFCISVMGVFLKNQQFAQMVIAQLSQWRLVYQAADKLLLTAAYFLARKAFRRKLAYNPGMLFLTSGLGLCGVGFLSWLTIQETSLHALFGWSMCIILLFLIYFLLLFYSKYVEEQKQRLALEMKEQMIDREYDLMVRQQKEQEELSHDMKNHLLVLSSMIGEGKLEEAEMYLEQMGEPLRQLEMMGWTGDPVLDVLLNNARSSAIKKKIRFTIQADALTLGDMEDREKCSLFSNLLDNAVEAADQVEAGERWIAVKIRRTGEMVFIELSNSMAGSPSVKDNRLVTTKRQGTGHGLGLKSAERVVEKYGGSLVCEYGDDVFTVLVSFLGGFPELP